MATVVTASTPARPYVARTRPIEPSASADIPTGQMALTEALRLSARVDLTLAAAREFSDRYCQR